MHRNTAKVTTSTDVAFRTAKVYTQDIA